MSRGLYSPQISADGFVGFQRFHEGSRHNMFSQIFHGRYGALCAVQDVGRCRTCPADQAKSGGHWGISLRKIDKAPKEWSEIQSLMEKADRLTEEAGSGGKSFSARQYTEVKGLVVGRGEMVAAVLATSQELQGTEHGR
jgi:hypothetical protein